MQDRTWNEWQVEWWELHRTNTSICLHLYMNVTFCVRLIFLCTFLNRNLQLPEQILLS